MDPNEQVAATEVDQVDDETVQNISKYLLAHEGPNPNPTPRIMLIHGNE